MKTAIVLLRGLAIVMLPFALLQAIVSALRFLDWLVFATGIGGVHFVNPPTPEMIIEVSRQMTYGLVLLGVPLVFWVIADIAASQVRAK